jgi:hypothetical protein
VISETCCCGASFESDEKQAMRQVREWRKTHLCRAASPDLQLRDSQLDATVDLAATPYTPELHVGFTRNDEE